MSTYDTKRPFVRVRCSQNAAAEAA